MPVPDRIQVIPEWRPTTYGADQWRGKRSEIVENGCIRGQDSARAVRVDRCLWQIFHRTFIQLRRFFMSGFVHSGGMVEVENKIRLLVVDDFKCFRESICTKLKTDGRFFIVGEAANAREAIQKARELAPDLILLDLVLPDMSGVDVLRELRTAVPSPKVLFLSGWGDESIVRHVLSKGARGYVLKGNAHQELFTAIEAAFLGRTFVSSRLKKPRKAAQVSLFQLADAT